MPLNDCNRGIPYGKGRLEGFKAETEVGIGRKCDSSYYAVNQQFFGSQEQGYLDDTQFVDTPFNTTTDTPSHPSHFLRPDGEERFPPTDIIRTR